MNLKTWNTLGILIIAVASGFLVVVMAAWVEQSNTPCLCPSQTPIEKISMVSYSVDSPTNLTLTLKNDLSANCGVSGYLVRDVDGNQYSRLYWNGPSVPSNAAGTVPITNWIEL